MKSPYQEEEQSVLLQQVEALEDVHTRFILNLPDEELLSADRIFFQLEQAWWFYDDFYCDSNPRIERYSSLKPFAKKMFAVSPLLNQRRHEFDPLWAEFVAYKTSISTYGAVLLNIDCTKIVLCQNYKGTSWTVPSGKVNQGETGLQAGARETYEETGFDPEGLRGLAKQLKQDAQEKALQQNILWDENNVAFEKLLGWNPLRENEKIVHVEEGTGKQRTCYICRGVPETFPFEPVARKEVGLISWHELVNLPKKTHSVLPFLRDLKRWIKKQQQKSNGKGVVPSNMSPLPRDNDKYEEFQPFFAEDGSVLCQGSSNVVHASEDKNKKSVDVAINVFPRKPDCTDLGNITPDSSGKENPGLALLAFLKKNDRDRIQNEPVNMPPSIDYIPLPSIDVCTDFFSASHKLVVVEPSCYNKSEDSVENDLEWMKNWVEGLRPSYQQMPCTLFKLDMSPVMATLNRWDVSES